MCLQGAMLKDNIKRKIHTTTIYLSDQQFHIKANDISELIISWYIMPQWEMMSQVQTDWLIIHEKLEMSIDIVI
jgi:hypothetical protein